MSDQKLTAVILAGGQGTRFWPISRMQKPKQFLSISSTGESLIQATARRIEGLVGKEHVWVVTNELHSKLVHEHVPNARILSEPQGRNTAASIGLAAIYLEKESPESIMLILPADHAVSDEKQLMEILKNASTIAAKQNLLVTIGVFPESPHTGYGYIKRGPKLANDAFAVARFFEKPSLERAMKYIESGDFYWNSGMFVWKPGVFLEAVRNYLPSLADGLDQIKAAIGTKEESQVLEKVFPTLESISVDFGILEHARNCAVVTGQNFGWNDVGSWDAWAENFAKEVNGNLLHGDVVVIDSQNCVVHSEKRLTAVVGADNLVVIDSGDALLVCPREHVQDVRKVVEELKRRGRNELT